jgi:hypothetical protein
VTRYVNLRAMETFFSRHTKSLDIDAPMRNKLWENQLIAVHYPEDREGQLRDEDNDSCDPTDYTGRAAQEMRTLVTSASPIILPSEPGSRQSAPLGGHHCC